MVPPAALASGNVVPAAVTKPVPFTAGDLIGEAQTPDSQCQVLFQADSAAQPPGQTSVSVTMVPLDPAGGGPTAAGLAYDSNAVRISACHEPSGPPVTPISFTVVLNFVAAGTGPGTRAVQRVASGCHELASTPASSFQLFAPATSAGTFVVAGPPGQSAAAPANRVVRVAEIAGPFLVVIPLVVVALTRLRQRPAGAG
ncbi:MAG: hypothetical protein ACRDJU_05545 [Actinomycetota bacterium]